MQLIVDTETSLGIEKNMSKLEELQNNKVESLNIEDVSKTKCNGNTEIIEVGEDDGSQQDINEIEEALANIPMSEENETSEYRAVTISNVSMQSNLETKNAQTDESQKLIAGKQANGLSIAEKEIVSQTKEVSEDDYLEDDIITISEEPFSHVKPPLSKTESIVKGNENNENKEGITKSTKIDNNPLIKEESEVIEIFEESEDFPLCAREKDLSKQEDNDEIVLLEEPNTKTNTDAIIHLETDDVEVIEVSNKPPASHENNTPSKMQEVTDDIEVIEECNETVSLCEKNSEPDKEKDDIEIVKASYRIPVSSEQNTGLIVKKEKCGVDDTAKSNENPVPCERITESIIKEEKDDIELIEDSNQPSVQCQNEKVNIKKETELTILGNKENTESETSTIYKDKANIVTKSTTEDQIDLTIQDISEQPMAANSKDVIDARELVEDISNNESIEKEANDTLKTRQSKPCENKPDSAISMTDNATGDAGIDTIQRGNNNLKGATEASAQTPTELKSNMHTKDSTSSNKEPSEPSKSSADKVDVSDTVAMDSPIVVRDDIMDIDEILEGAKDVERVDSPLELKYDDEDITEPTTNNETITATKITTPMKEAPVNSIIDKPIICKLSNTLDILSDDDEDQPSNVEPPKVASPKLDTPAIAAKQEKQCINIEDDDDIMVIDEDNIKTEQKVPVDANEKEVIPVTKPDVNTVSQITEKVIEENNETLDKNVQNVTTPPVADEINDCNMEIDINEKPPENRTETPPIPLVPENFLKTAKKKLSDMTRDDLEEFCILKIVESIVDRSSLSDIKNKLRTMTLGLEEFRKKAMMLTKQNRDLQVILKSVQEEQKKASLDTPVIPLKINRSVGMQVFMEKIIPRKKGPPLNANNKPMNPNTGLNRPMNAQGPRPQKVPNQNIPVPRLVPAHNTTLKTPCTIPQMNQVNNPNKMANLQNGIIRNPSPSMKAEKRQHNKIASSVTVDLTDDEPPAKMSGGPKTSPAPPVRLVPPQNLMAPQRHAFATGVNSPRKVYIPISGPQNQGLRPGQTIMLKTVPTSGMRPRCPAQQVTRVGEPNVRTNKSSLRHPAPLPFAMKQYQPPNWKTLPPAPDLKLSKVENGIVISWQINNVPEDSYEEIASYQLYAYQETATPPSTTLWKKIGDVKALPLPMACTLTQFMAGFKYYFAVRAVDIRSRLGPFSLPGSILLINKSI